MLPDAANRFHLIQRVKMCLFIILLLSLPVPGPSDGVEPPVTDLLGTGIRESIDINGEGFRLGEKQVFTVQYGIVTAGTATLEVGEDIKEFNGEKVVEFISTAKSSDFFSLFFKVRDRASSLASISTLCSTRFEKKLQEGKHKKHETVVFDQESGTVTYSNGETVEIPGCARDPLAALYCIRSLPLEIGWDIAIPNHVDRKNYPVRVKVLRKERVDVPAGTFDCIVVEPVLKSAGIFRHKGEMKIWFTDDSRKMPVLMKTRVMIGSVQAKLSSFKNGEELEYGIAISGDITSGGENSTPGGEKE